MSPTPSPGDTAPAHPHAESGPAAGYFTEVLVFAGILHATAETLELIHDFFDHTDQAERTHLGRFLIARHPDEDTTDPGMEAGLLLHELTEAADLLHTLADGTGEETPH